jgi:primosomal protein N' (replication factor Y)
MAGERPVVEVAVFVPLRKTFHYLEGDRASTNELAAGSLVRVPFGRGVRNGIVLGPASNVVRGRELKSIIDISDESPIISAELMRLAEWAAEYYQHPIGEVLAAMLPGILRRDRAPVRQQSYEWIAEDAFDMESLARKAPRQAALLSRIGKGAATLEDFKSLDFDWRRALRELQKKGLVTRRICQSSISLPLDEAIELNDAQHKAATSLISAFGSFRTYLLHGVTGSGKTEVYLAAIANAIALNTSALMLVPEIILTQSMVLRLKRRFGSAVGVLHSGLSDSERRAVWLDCRNGEVKVLMGTRSAVWAPLPRLGFIIVDEEHDGSFKQQEGFRYSARDVAIKRAQQLGVPIVIGTATPSLEAYLNIKKGKYTYLSLPERAGVAKLPAISCIDMRGLPITGGLSEHLCRAISERLQRKEQTLLFLNRRGFAPIVLCHQCGYIAICQRCDAKLVWHKGRAALVCHHCGSQKRTQNIAPCCPSPELVPLGLGTEQVEEALNEMFPGKVVVRIDRDTMRQKGAMEQVFSAVRDGSVDILIGTQMLAKGHDFSRVSLVGIVDADSQLFSTDFRAEEKLAQTITQVAGRAGRAEIPGEVLIQTHQPHHHLLQTLLAAGYDRFAKEALEERRLAALPPYVPMALIRAESANPELPLKFLTALTDKVRGRGVPGVEILGPIPAAMEKRAGRYRAQVMVTASARRVLASSVKAFIECSNEVPTRRNVRWSVDIDPQDTI